MWSSTGGNKKRGINLLLIVIYFNSVKKKHAGDSHGTCFQMLTFPVKCSLSKIASRFTARAADTSFSGYE